MTVVTNPARTNSDEEETTENTQELQQTPNHTYSDEGTDCKFLYDNEKRSDIVFVAGMNNDTWRYPGHRRVLASASPSFAALLSTSSDVIVIDYVDKRGFEQLLRHHYSLPTVLNSVTTARCTLDAAYKFLCPPLAEQCACRLDEMLNAGAALEVLRDLRYLCSRLPGAASAPPLPAFMDDQAARFLGQCSQWCDSLAHNCLLVIDENADEVLKNERLEELSYEDLSLIVKRDTLRVSSELILIEALFRWSTAHCKRYKRSVTANNRRVALGGLSYCPRYLLLSGTTLDYALSLELLSPVEQALVVGRAQHHRPPIPVGVEQEEMLRRWACARPIEPAALPVHLSPRSEPHEPEPEPSFLCLRRPKRPKQPTFDPNEKPRGCCARFGDGLLRAFICLID